MDPLVGEVVFNTGMVGYQRLMTDPSYCGQIVVLTYPLVGNTGVNELEFEAAAPALSAIVVREMTENDTHYLGAVRLLDWLSGLGIPVLSGVDTRAVVRQLREQGTMNGALAEGSPSPVEPGLAERIRSHRLFHPVGRVTPAAPCVVPAPDAAAPAFRLAVLHYGCKSGILRSLSDRNCELTIFPAGTPADTILAGGFDGVVLSNGPGDPADCTHEAEQVGKLAGRLPILAICLGHQLLAMAMGGTTEALAFGHRGSNHPVKDLVEGRSFVTSQNHGYAVRPGSLPPGVATVTHVSLNDGSVEGLSYRDIPAISVQFHPEASPGPADTEYLFDRFLAMLGRRG